LKEIDLLSYQVNELTESDIKQGEEQELESERTALMSFEKIFSLLNDAKMALDGDENYGGGFCINCPSKSVII
jgi:DNA repair protein RecN (Recombination protein N)